VTGFLTTANKSEPVEETKVKILYDKENWYIGIEAMTEHAWSELKTKTTARDGNVWEDDAMELFLMPPNADYFHWIINSAGVFYDAKVRDVGFDSKAEIKTKVLKDRYVIEARLPTGPMGVQIADGQTWQMHFYRGCTNLQPPNAAEGSSLDGTPPHEQTLFRRAVIGTSAIANGNFAVIVDTKKEEKGIRSEKFPEGWGGNHAKLIPGKNNKNQIELEDLIYTYMSVPSSERGNVISGEIVASGKGKLTIWASTCVRKPDDTRGFGHEIKHEVGTFDLPETPAPLQFKFDLDPYEVGYLYFRVAGNALIDCVSASRTRK